VRDYSGVGGESSLGSGVGMNEARHWHRRAYGGLGNTTQMLPAEIGHAAAYEAYRTWIHNSSIYEPLSGDIERQREGLIGLAIAEATRLLQFGGRSRDHYSRMEASDAAAATASIIFHQSQSRAFDDMDGAYRSRSRAGSFSGYGGASAYAGGSPYMGGGHSPYTASSGYPMSSPGDPYAFDNQVLYPSRHGRHRSRSRSRSRRHSSSHHHRPTVTILPGSSQYGTSPVPIPGAVVPASPYNAYGSYGSYGQPMNSPMPAYAGSTGGYAGSAGGYAGTMIVPTSSRSHRHSISHHNRPRSTEGYAYTGSMPGYVGSQRY